MRKLLIATAFICIAASAQATDPKDLPEGHKSALWRQCDWENRMVSAVKGSKDCDCYVNTLTSRTNLAGISLAIVEAQENLRERTFGDEHQKDPINQLANQKLNEELAIYAMRKKADAKSLKGANYLHEGTQLDIEAKNAAAACQRQSIELTPRKVQ